MVSAKSFVLISPASRCSRCGLAARAVDPQRSSAVFLDRFSQRNAVTGIAGEGVLLWDPGFLPEAVWPFRQTQWSTLGKGFHRLDALPRRRIAQRKCGLDDERGKVSCVQQGAGKRPHD